jgi:hypothetical protein
MKMIRIQMTVSSCLKGMHRPRLDWLPRPVSPGTSIVKPDLTAHRLPFPGAPMSLMTPAGPPMFVPYRPPPFYPSNNFRPPNQHQGFGTGSNHMPLPPPGFFPNNYNNNNGRPPHFQPGFRPPQNRPGIMHQDPLSDIPHSTFQAHRIAKQEGGATTGEQAGPGDAAPVPAAAVIEAAPQIRDLRKEAAAFVPRAAKKKKTVASAIQVNAAPPPGDNPAMANEEPSMVSEDKEEVKPPAPVYNPAAGGLMGKLSGILGSAPASRTTDKPKDDYQSFLAGLDNLPQ